MNWLEKLIPSWCTNRNAKQDKKDINAPSLLPEIQITTQNEQALSLINPLENPHKPKLTNFSRRSTNFTADTYNEAVVQECQVLLNCNNCGLEATGYCPCCPNTRFCIECFEKSHKLLKGLHRLISYQPKLCPSQKQLENLIKIKKFM